VYSDPRIDFWNQNFQLVTVMTGGMIGALDLDLKTVARTALITVQAIFLQVAIYSAVSMIFHTGISAGL
jgi:hypothetical protein